MSVKSDVKRTQGADGEPEEWITGAQARRILGWDSTASVRNRAKAGGFRWRKGEDRRIRYHRRDVMEYAGVLREPQSGGGSHAGAEA